MPSPRQWLCAVLAASPLLTPGLAEARFGKRSEPSSKVHGATPVGSSQEERGGSRGSGHALHVDPSDVAAAVDTTVSVLELLLHLAATPSPPPTVSVEAVSVEALPDEGSPPMYPYSHPASKEVADTQRPEQAPSGRMMFRLGVAGQSAGDGLALGLNLGLEGLHWGVDGALTSLKLPAEDGSGDVDARGLYSAHLTYALVSSDRGRLRAEGGVAVAVAPDISFVGPSLGLSFERCLVGALDVEGRGQAVLVPHLQLDARVGLALHLGVLSVRGGWRVLLLDDRGLVDGEAHRDVVGGPYAGLGLNI